MHCAWMALSLSTTSKREIFRSGLSISKVEDGVAVLSGSAKPLKIATKEVKLIWEVQKTTWKAGTIGMECLVTILITFSKIGLLFSSSTALELDIKAIEKNPFNTKTQIFISEDTMQLWV